MRGRPKKGEGFAEALSKEIKVAISKATVGGSIPTSKDLKKLTQAIRSLVKIMKKASAAPVVKARGGPIYKKKGPKPKAAECKVEGCARPHYAKGLCASHYNSALRRKKLAEQRAAGKPGPKPGRKKAKPGPKPKAKRGRKKAMAARTVKTCSIENCGGKHYAKGMCRKHYMAEKYAAKKKTGKK